MQAEIVIENMDLIPVEKINVPALFTDEKKVQALLDAITKKAKEHVPDVSTASGRKAIASNAAKVSKSKTFLDSIGKDFVAERKAELKVTDNLRKKIRDTLDELRDSQRKPLTDWEQAEEDRKAKEEAERQYNEDWDSAITDNEWFDRQREIERKEAEFARIEAERLAKEEAERIEKERIEREARIAKEAEERTKAEAEAAAKKERERFVREKKEAEERAAQAERDRVAAIERARADTEQAESRRIAAIETARQRELAAIGYRYPFDDLGTMPDGNYQKMYTEHKKAWDEDMKEIYLAKLKQEREEATKAAEEKARKEAAQKEAARKAKEAAEQAEAERKARNKAHQKKINREALESFLNNGVGAEVAKSIITLIAQNKIRHAEINY